MKPTTSITNMTTNVPMIIRIKNMIGPRHTVLIVRFVTLQSVMLQITFARKNSTTHTTNVAIQQIINIVFLDNSSPANPITIILAVSKSALENKSHRFSIQVSMDTGSDNTSHTEMIEEIMHTRSVSVHKE